MTIIAVHGRFQPFHRDHLTYVLSAISEARARRVIVGITQFRSRSLKQFTAAAAAHRGYAQHNPMSYYERSEMIRRALVEAGLSSDAFAVAPFPIEDPNELEDFLPLEVPIYTTTYDEWNEEKIKVLRAAGYKVHNLWTRNVSDKAYQGATIRSQMLVGDLAWQSSVTPAVAEYLLELGVPDRVRRATRSSHLADAGDTSMPSGRV